MTPSLLMLSNAHTRSVEEMDSFGIGTRQPRHCLSRLQYLTKKNNSTCKTLPNLFTRNSQPS